MDGRIKEQDRKSAETSADLSVGLDRIAEKVGALLGKNIGGWKNIDVFALEPLLDELAERRKTEALEVAWSKLQNIMPDLRHRPVPSEAFIPLICHEVEKALRECRATQGELPPFAQELVNEAADFFGFNPGTQGLDSDPGSLGTVIHDPNGGRG